MVEASADPAEQTNVIVRFGVSVRERIEADAPLLAADGERLGRMMAAAADRRIRSR